MLNVISAAPACLLPWSEIDTVLLDMDGTLLDLRFDNYFWQEFVPEQYAQKRGLPLAAAKAELAPRFEAFRGQLVWYCTDFWSRELAMPIAALKESVREQIAWLDGAENFLKTMRANGKRLVLVTNAHTDALRIKDSRTGLTRHFDASLSSHTLGFPKEHPDFWPALQALHPFDAERTLFVDDSLPVLRVARIFGIKHIVAIAHPDTTQSPRDCAEFASALRISESLMNEPVSRSR